MTLKERIDEITKNIHDSKDDLLTKQRYARQAILTAVAESLPKEIKPHSDFRIGITEPVYLSNQDEGWNAYRNEVLTQLGKEER